MAFCNDRSKGVFRLETSCALIGNVELPALGLKGRIRRGGCMLLAIAMLVEDSENCLRLRPWSCTQKVG